MHTLILLNCQNNKLFLQRRKYRRELTKAFQVPIYLSDRLNTKNHTTYTYIFYTVYYTVLDNK